MALAPLPARLSSTRLELDRLNAEVNKFTVDTINHLKSLRLQVQADDAVIQAELDALEASLATAPGSVIGTAAPSQGIGGGNSLGAGPLLARSNHDHTIRETSGPTNLTVGSVPPGGMLWRNGGASVLTGRLVAVQRLAGTASTTSAVVADVSADLSIALGVGEYTALWFVYYNTAIATTGLLLSVNFTGTFLRQRFGLMMLNSAATVAGGSSPTFDTLLGAAGVGPGGTNEFGIMSCRLEVTGAGTLSLRYASGVAGSNVSVLSQSNMLVIQQS